MNAEQANRYIGLPHEDGANGPYAYDCWGLLRHVQGCYFNVKMPDAPLGDFLACKQMFQDELETGNWRSVETPEHGDGVLLRGGVKPHVGIWLDVDGGGVLHSVAGYGVIFSTLRTLKTLGFPRITYYRLHK